MRLSVPRAAVAAASAAMIAAVTAGAGGASAALATHRVPAGTMCQAALPGCGTLMVDSPGGALALQAGAARAGAPVLVQQQAPASSLQDWTREGLGTVKGIPPRQRRSLGITAYDLRTYGTDAVTRLELTPAGRRTGLCADGAAAKLVLASCRAAREHDPSADVFIEVPTAAGHLVAAAQTFLLLEQAQAPGAHLALRGSFRPGAQVSLARRAHVGVEIWYQYNARPLPPLVNSVSPAIFANEGGMTVQITGLGFRGASAVLFGTVPATTFTVNSDSSITAIVPAATPGHIPLFTDLRVVRDGLISQKSPADGFIQEDAQIDEVCVGNSATLVLYSVPDPQGNTTVATVTDTTLPPNAIPTSTVTDEAALDNTPGWLQSTTPLVVPLGHTDTYSMSADTGLEHWTNVPIAAGGPITCGFTVWRG